MKVVPIKLNMNRGLGSFIHVGHGTDCSVVTDLAWDGQAVSGHRYNSGRETIPLTYGQWGLSIETLLGLCCGCGSVACYCIVESAVK